MSAARHPLRSFLLAATCCAAVVAGVFTTPSTARISASTYYVSVHGSDQNPGTLDQPWRTPQHAVDEMAPGDTTFVMTGAYGKTYCDGSSGDGGSAEGGYASLRAYAGHHPVLTGAFGSILTMDCDYFEVQGFEIAGPAIVNGTNVYPVSGSDHGRLIDNDIHGSICQGISMDTNTAEYEIIGNRIHHNGVQETPCDQQAHGLYLKGNRHIVQNNLVYENNNYGIHRWPEGNDTLIAYNTIAFNGSSGIVLGGSDEMTGNRIVSNVIAFNARFGISRYPNRSCDIYSNVIFGNTLGGIQPGFPLGCVGPNQLSDPRFANSERRDFHLLTGSPAIDAGDPVYAPRFDHDGLSRRLGAGPDIGAFEFASSVPGPTPTPPDTKPSLQARPTLRGRARKGRKIVASRGTWFGATPMSVMFRWRRCNRHGRRCTNIPSARRATFRLRSKDVGSRLCAVVVMTNAYGSTSVRTRLSLRVRR